MFNNFNKIIDKISKPKTEGVDPTFTNIGKKEEYSTPVLENGAEMYTVLIDGGEMGVVKPGDIQSTKQAFDQLYLNNKEKIDALNGKKPEEVLPVLKSLMN